MCVMRRSACILLISLLPSFARAAIRLTPEVAIADPSPAPQEGLQRPDAVATDGTDFLVAWVAPGGLNTGVVRADGKLASLPRLAIARSEQIHDVSACWTGAAYLVTWCEPWGQAFFTEQAAGKIAKQRPGASPADEFDVGVGSYPSGIACGAEGSVWYTMPGTNKIGRFKRDCFCSESFDVPTYGPYGITVGPDGSVWFTEPAADKIGRLQLRPQGDADGNGAVDVADVFWLINFLFAGGPVPVP